MTNKTTSRELILARIAKTLKSRKNILYEVDYSNEEIYKAILPDAITCFKNELEAISGKVILCDTEVDLFIQLKKFLSTKNTIGYCIDNEIIAKLSANDISYTNDPIHFNDMEIGITGSEILIARTGSVVVSSKGQSGRQMNVFPPIHIVLASAKRMVNYPEDALKHLHQLYGKKLPSTITTITGPSRTADIEKTLVLGAHGPKEFIVFLSLS